MDKLLVEVYTPAIGAVYDVLIPHNVRIYELTALITNAAVKLSGGLFMSQDAVLCDGNTGVIYDIGLTVYDIKLNNGSKLMLI